MNRAEYNEERRRIRGTRDTRSDRGLPRHPDGSGMATCPRCSGTGVIDRDHWQPELCTSSTCSLCCGEGTIADGYRDPLLRLRYARSRRRRDPQAYAHLRKFCAIRAWQLPLIEVCVGCAIATREAVQAWREVA